MKTVDPLPEFYLCLSRTYLGCSAPSKYGLDSIEQHLSRVPSVWKRAWLECTSPEGVGLGKALISVNMKSHSVTLLYRTPKSRDKLAQVKITNNKGHVKIDDKHWQENGVRRLGFSENEAGGMVGQADAIESKRSGVEEWPSRKVTVYFNC